LTIEITEGSFGLHGIVVPTAVECFIKKQKVTCKWPARVRQHYCISWKNKGTLSLFS